MGGQAPSGPVPPTQAAEDNQFMMPWGWTSPAQRFGMSAMRYLRDTGTTTKIASRNCGCSSAARKLEP